MISRALKFTTRSLVCAIRCKRNSHDLVSFAFKRKNEKSLWMQIMGTLTRIKSWIRLASPRLANTNRRVTGPGIPSVYPSAFLATVASPTGAFSLSSVCSVPADPPTNWMEKKWNYTKNETIFQTTVFHFGCIKYRINSKGSYS